MALIFVISSFEVHVPGVEELPFRDKAIHFVEYAVLGWLCTGAARRTWPSAALWRTALFAVFISALWGLSDEIHQAMVPGRSAELADVAADLLGSAFGSAVWHLFSARSVRHYTGKFTSTD